MRRLLKKKAWDKVNLYHVTNSQLFMLIVQDGQMVPGTYVDRASYGTGNNGLWRDVYKPSMHTPDQMVTRYMDELIRTINPDNGYDITYTKELKNQIQQKYDEIKAANPDNFRDVIDQTTIDMIETIQPSGSDGVYLSRDPGRGMYRGKMWKSLPWPQLPAFNVEFMFYLDTDALGPDLDDGQVDKSISTPPWKQTLHNSGQCIHYGPISMDQVESVWIDKLPLDYYHVGDSELHEELEHQFLKLVNDKAWISLDDAYNQITKFYAKANELVGTIDPENAVAKLKTKRLKKRA